MRKSILYGFTGMVVVIYSTVYGIDMVTPKWDSVYFRIGSHLINASPFIPVFLFMGFCGLIWCIPVPSLFRRFVYASIIICIIGVIMPSY